MAGAKNLALAHYALYQSSRQTRHLIPTTTPIFSFPFFFVNLHFPPLENYPGYLPYPSINLKTRFRRKLDRWC